MPESDLRPPRPPNDPAAAPTPVPDRGAGSRALVLGVIFLLAMLLRLCSLGSQSVWIDEAYSLRVAAQPVLSMLDETARDNHPPFYYLLLAGWMRLGPGTETWARLLSALLGLVFVAVFYFFCREIVPETTAQVATLLLALSPLAVWHSQDARMYSLMLVCVYLALTCFLIYLRRPTRGVLAGFVSTLILALYTHVYVAFLIPVILFSLVFNRREIPARSARNLLLGIAVAGAAYVPWAWVVFSAALHRAGFYKPITVFSIPYVLYAFSVGYSLGPSLAQMHRLARTVAIPPDQIWVVGVAALVFGGALLSGLVAVRRCRAGQARFLLLLFGVPLLLPVLVTLVSRIDFNARYALISFPAYLVLLALGLVSRRGVWLRIGLAGGVFLLMGFSLLNHYRDQKYSKEDARSAVQWIRSRSGPQDCVLVIGVYPAFHYYEGATDRSRWLDFRETERLPATEATLAQWSHQCPRLWFVTGRSWEEDPLDLAIPTLEKFFDRADEKSLSGIRIVEFRPRSEDGRGEAAETGTPGCRNVTSVSRTQPRTRTPARPAAHRRPNLFDDNRWPGGVILASVEPKTVPAGTVHGGISRSRRRGRCRRSSLSPPLHTAG